MLTKLAAEAGASADAEATRDATARMFRSIKAGRSWVRAQAAKGAASQTSACVLMKPGNDDPPLFMLPGAPGSVLQLGPLAGSLSMPMAAYAIKPRGLEEGETPCATIAEMAQYSIAAIRAVCPNGPYLLLGYSAGGLIALEIARQLAEAGNDVPLLVLVDTHPGKQFWPLSCHAGILGRRLLSAVGALLRHRPTRLVEEVRRRVRSLSGYLAESGVTLLPPPPITPEGWSAASQRVYMATYNAGEAYRPVRYAGKVLFIQPEEIANLEPRSPARVWRNYIRQMEVRRVPGAHADMVERAPEPIAAEIAPRLALAIATPARREPRRSASDGANSPISAATLAGNR